MPLCVNARLCAYEADPLPDLRREKSQTGGGFLDDPDAIFSRVYIRRNRAINKH